MTSNSYFSVSTEAHPLHIGLAVCIGTAADIFLKTGRFNIRIYDFSRVVEPAVNQCRIRFLYEADGTCIGFYILAWFDSHAHVNFAKKISIKDKSDWTSGDILWVVDFCLIKRMSFLYLLRAYRNFRINIPGYYSYKRNRIRLTGATSTLPYINYFLELPDKFNHRYDHEIEMLGYLIMLFSASPSHTNFKFDYFLKVIIPAIRLKTIQIYFNKDGFPVAYLVWNVTKNMKTSLLECFILDFLAPFGHAKNVIIHVRNGILLAYDIIKYQRKQKFCVRYKRRG